MFVITTPADFKVGATAKCKINKEPARVTWRDATHLVIEPGDVRPIVVADRYSDRVELICGDSGTLHKDYDIEQRPDGSVAIMQRQ
jgi:hypothetical protein